MDTLQDIAAALPEGAADLLGLTSVEAGGGLFCGVSEQEFAINGVTHSWPRGSKLAWGIAFSRLGSLSDMDCKDAITEALKEISDCCDVTHQYLPNAQQANIKIISQRLDGASGVLGDCQIPVGRVSQNDTQLILRCDDSEVWGLFQNAPRGQIDFYRFVLHELLHGHGLGHKPSNIAAPALIAPMYSTAIRNLQAADKSELVRRYGSPTAPIQPPTEPPIGTADVTVRVGGHEYFGTLARRN